MSLSYLEYTRDDIFCLCTILVILFIYQSIDATSEAMSRQISRQTSQVSTTRRISSIREEDLRPIAQTSAIEESPDEVFPKERKPHEKPTVIKKVCDAGTMTAPEVQEHVSRDMIRRQDSTVREIVDGPVRLKELRGVPIQQIEEVVVHFNPNLTKFILIVVFLVEYALQTLFLAERAPECA